MWIISWKSCCAVQVVAFIAVSVCVHCKAEHNDTSVKALVATLRKRLSAARDSLPPTVLNLQVQRWSLQVQNGPLPHQEGSCTGPD